jgi:YaiO family outer membrane protein
MKRSPITKFLSTAFVFLIFSHTFAEENLLAPSEGPLYKASIDYTHDYFDQDLNSWKMFAIAVKRKFPLGAIIARTNLAERFDQKGAQFEVDAYPSLGKGRYAYLNFGYSGSSIFPEYRLGGELYQALGAGFEISAGVRESWFPSSSTTEWTGSLAKYFGAFYIAAHPVFVRHSIGNSFSGFLELKAYINDQTYINLKGGGGKYSEQKVSTLEVFGLKSRWISAGTHWLFREHTAVNASFGLENTEVRPDTDRLQTTIY